MIEAGEQTVLTRVARLVRDRYGLETAGWRLTSRVGDRMRSLGLRDPAAYSVLLSGAGGDAELEALAESLRVGETRFFRNRQHVRVLRRVVAPDLAARRGRERRVRAWSAGCATGEEAYTLAMLLGDVLPASRGWQVEVLGGRAKQRQRRLILAQVGVGSRVGLRLRQAPLLEETLGAPGDRLHQRISRMIAVCRRRGTCRPDFFGLRRSSGGLSRRSSCSSAARSGASARR